MSLWVLHGTFLSFSYAPIFFLSFSRLNFYRRQHLISIPHALTASDSSPLCETGLRAVLFYPAHFYWQHGVLLGVWSLQVEEGDSVIGDAKCWSSFILFSSTTSRLTTHTCQTTRSRETTIFKVVWNISSSFPNARNLGVTGVVLPKRGGSYIG
ncbi:hypothetical protein F4775DRAFT_212846 [Biscogniauxia sp. FL1348]|nr:hypothetical protein F4775DRAFT_212846 [Biscogniauxia sp. FL1348]